MDNQNKTDLIPKKRGRKRAVQVENEDQNEVNSSPPKLKSRKKVTQIEKEILEDTEKYETESLPKKRGRKKLIQIENSNNEKKEEEENKQEEFLLKSQPSGRKKAIQDENQISQVENTIVVAKTTKSKPKTKAKLIELASLQLEVLCSLLKENLTPYINETVSKIQTILNNLSTDNNKISMFLTNKDYTDNNIKKKGLDALIGIDFQRYELLQKANDNLPEENQFYFFIFESCLQIAERKGETTNMVKIICVYDANGKPIKKYHKKDLKKKTKTYTSFINNTFNPSYSKPFHIEDKDIWGSKGTVEAHYNDYNQDELFEELANDRHAFGYSYNPWWSSDDEPDPKHFTTTYKSFFLVLWPKAFSDENLVHLKIAGPSKNATSSASNQVLDENNEISSQTVVKPKKTNQKQNDFSSEYAKSNRSSCKLCSRKIEKNELRFAIYIPIETAQYSMATMPAWHHLECFFKSKNKKPKKINDIGGFDELRPEDQKIIETKLEKK